MSNEAHNEVLLAAVDPYVDRVAAIFAYNLPEREVKRRVADILATIYLAGRNDVADGAPKRNTP